ncbi:MAG: hypothetical protein JNL70_23080 [Saprospiraceae bacterium]|nr:hypothetical protein [Saprospiraceae bacterium]
MSVSKRDTYYLVGLSTRHCERSEAICKSRVPSPPQYSAFNWADCFAALAMTAVVL